MQPNNINEQKLNELLKSASKSMGIPPEELKRRLQSGDAPSGRAGERLSRVLKNKEAMNELLNSPKAQAILKSLMNGSGSNG